MIRICKNAVVDSKESHSPPSQGVHSKLDTSLSVDPRSSNSKETSIPGLVKSLRIVTAPMDTLVPVVVTADASVPSIVVADELKIFHSALTLLSQAIDRTAEGMVCFAIRVEVDRVVFECTDTGGDAPISSFGNIPGEARDSFYQPCISSSNGDDRRVGLSTVEALVKSMESGQCGYRPSDAGTGSLFWFSIPLARPVVPTTGVNLGSNMSQPTNDGKSSRKRLHGSVR